MRVASIALILNAALSAPAAAGTLGEHPAIVAQRVHAAQGYDYASKFYPHPAWLYLRAEAPRALGHHPAVIVAEREQQPAPPRVAHAPQPPFSDEE